VKVVLDGEGEEFGRLPILSRTSMIKQFMAKKLVWDFVHVPRWCNFKAHNLALWANVYKVWGSIPISSILSWIVVREQDELDCVFSRLLFLKLFLMDTIFKK
jgi:hypothetical protein